MASQGSSSSSRRPEPPPEEDLVYEDRAKPFLIKVGLVFFLLIVIGFSVRPLMRLWDHQRGRDTVEQVEAMIRAGRPPVEVDPVLAEAMRASPRNPGLLRAAGQYAAANGIDEGLNWWRQLLATPEAGREDRYQFVEQALSAGRLELSGPELTSMFRFDPADQATLRLYIRHNELNDDLLAATAVARHWVAVHVDVEEARFELGRLLIRHPSVAARTEGQSVLQTLAIGDGKLRHPALNLLAAEPDLSPAQRGAVIRAIESRSGVGLPDRLRVASLRLRAEPEKRAEILAAAERSATMLPGSTNQAVLATWLSQMGEYSRLLELFPFEKARMDPGLLSYHLGALAALDRWSEIEPHLNDKNSSLDSAQSHLLLAAAAFRQGKLADAEQAFALATRAATEDVAKLMLVATQAERLGLARAAVGAYEVLAKIPGQANVASAQIIQLISKMPDARAALDAIRRVTTQLPNSNALAVEQAYLRILTNDGLPATRNQLAELAVRNPASREIRLTHALAELQSLNSLAARALVEAEPIAWLTAPVRWQVIHAAVLGGTGDTDGAREWARRIDVSRLKPQEKELIKNWLR
ncbi:MAG: hypothetical protein EXS36_12815 [Pedosphaera sp.]|nr:hypothetical protein [Pedosphaera sp.]